MGRQVPAYLRCGTFHNLHWSLHFLLLDLILSFNPWYSVASIFRCVDETAENETLALFAYIILHFHHQPHPWEGATTEERMLNWLYRLMCFSKSLFTLHSPFFPLC